MSLLYIQLGNLYINKNASEENELENKHCSWDGHFYRNKLQSIQGKICNGKEKQSVIQLSR